MLWQTPEAQRPTPRVEAASRLGYPFGHDNSIKQGRWRT